MLSADIFNIQKFSVHDGPGIRTTVFFKGCPLRCVWCHNPESKSFRRELLRNPERCTLCGRCDEIWRKNGMTSEQGDGQNFKEAEKAAAGCVNNALEIAGRRYTVPELMKEIEKDRMFYEESGGGVTFSGGEAMCRIEFLAELAKGCRRKGISVAVDTCGHVPFESFERILEYVDIFLYDIKMLDADLHKRYTGADNALIIENLEKLLKTGANVNLRLPIIEGINAGDDALKPLVEFVRRLRVESINLLPYHDIARGKYARLGQDYPEDMAVPSMERMEEIKKSLEPYCSKITIGG